MARSQKGFSLIELSIVLTIISSLAAVAAIRYSYEEKIQNEKQVFVDFKIIRDAIDNYVKKHNYYPCPALNHYAKDDPQFRVGIRNNAARSSCDNAINTVFMNRTPGTDENGNDILTDYDSAATAIYSPAYTGYVANGIAVKKLYFGIVPCSELGLPMNCAVSPTGEFYTYAVSGQLAAVHSQTATTIAKTFCTHFVTDANTLSPIPDPVRVFGSFPAEGDCLDGQGNLDEDLGNNGLRDAYNNPSESRHSPGDYVLIYHGTDGIGAYLDNGVANSKKMPEELTSIGPGWYAGDNKCQGLNHKLFSAASRSQYFTMPRVPYTSGIIFGDIVYAGKSESFKPVTCVMCKHCSSSDLNAVRVIFNTTSISPVNPNSYTITPGICSLVSSSCPP